MKTNHFLICVHLRHPWLKKECDFEFPLGTLGVLAQARRSTCKTSSSQRTITFVVTPSSLTSQTTTTASSPRPASQQKAQKTAPKTFSTTSTRSQTVHP